MTTGKHDAAGHLDASTESGQPVRRLRQWWSVITTLLVIAIFAQAVFAGAMLSGFVWGRAAHSMSAVALIAATLSAGLVSAVTLRRIARGPQLAVILLALAVVVFLQTAVGKFAADGANLMWLHVPLGVALLGFAGQAAAAARRLGGA
jgi:hypothetical protein